MNLKLLQLETKVKYKTLCGVFGVKTKASEVQYVVDGEVFTSKREVEDYAKSLWMTLKDSNC